MNEFLQFIKLLQRNRITIIAIPLVTLVLCFFLVRELPDQYKSHGSISTGLVDKTDQVLSMAEKDQDSEINRKFDNLIQMMMMKKVLDQVSYQLLLHDLQASTEARFRKSKTIEAMDKATRANYIALIKKKHEVREELLPGNKANDGLISLLREIGYDNTSIASKITIYRQKSSDYISIDAEAEDAALSAFLINTLSSEFIAYYASRIDDSNTQAIAFLANFLNQKKTALTGVMNGLRNFKIRNRVLNLNEQARALYGQIADYETKREMTEKDIVAYTAAIKNIDNKFNPADRRYLESALAGINQDIITSKQQLKAVNEAYIKSNFDVKYKKKVDSLQTKLTREIGDASDRYIYNPMVVKENLVNQKLTLEVALEMSTNSVSSIQEELRRLNRRFDGLVPNEAQIQEFETNIDISGKEYIEALQRYNNATLQSSFLIYLKQTEKAVPGTIQPSKKMVLLIVSGVISFAFCLLVFFILYYFDNSIQYPVQLANATDIPVIGTLNFVQGGLDLGKIQNEGSSEKSVNLFKDLIRSIRYELDNEYPHSKVIVITSLGDREGKTLLAMSLAWAFSRINKTVMIIDGNFTNQNITNISDGGVSLEKIIKEEDLQMLYAKKAGISIIGNGGGDTSLNEIASENEIKQLLSNLKSHFDVVIVEADALIAMNKAKEWIMYADLVVPVFASGKTIKLDEKPHIDYLKTLGSKLPGWVLTGTRDISKRTKKKNKK